MPTFEEVERQLKSLDGYSRWLGKREMKALPSILWEDESIVGGVQGTYNAKNGLMVATDRRLIFVDKGMLGGLTVEDFPYDRVTSIQYETGLMFGKIRIYASGNRADIEMIEKSQVQPFAEKIRARITGGSNQPPEMQSASTSAAGTDDLVAHIERLADLHARGILTADEFAAAKSKAIARVP